MYRRKRVCEVCGRDHEDTPRGETTLDYVSAGREINIGWCVCVWKDWSRIHGRLDSSLYRKQSESPGDEPPWEWLNETPVGLDRHIGEKGGPVTCGVIAQEWSDHTLEVQLSAEVFFRGGFSEYGICDIHASFYRPRHARIQRRAKIEQPAMLHFECEKQRMVVPMRWLVEDEMIEQRCMRASDGDESLASEGGLGDFLRGCKIAGTAHTSQSKLVPLVNILQHSDFPVWQAMGLITPPVTPPSEAATPRPRWDNWNAERDAMELAILEQAFVFPGCWSRWSRRRWLHLAHREVLYTNPNRHPDSGLSRGPMGP